MLYKNLDVKIPYEFIEKVPVIDANESISKALSHIYSNGGIILTRQGEYFGIVDDRRIIRSKGERIKKSMKVGNFAVKVEPVDSTYPLSKAISNMFYFKCKMLPFIESNQIFGALKRNTLLKAILSLKVLESTKVEEIMTTPVIAIDFNASISAASASMRKEGINRLLVIKDGRVYGIISTRDIFFYSLRDPSRAMQLQNSKSERNAKVGEICQTNIVSIGAKAPVENAIREMVERNISSIAVIRGDKYTGIVTVSDIFEHIVRISSASSEEIEITGFDEDTKEYEEDIRSEVKKAYEKLMKSRELGLKRIYVRVKSMKGRRYEAKARAETKRGIITSFSSGFLLSRVISDMLEKLIKRAERRIDIVISQKRLTGSSYEE
ncbi:MAG: CBS domain-containing protein [Candidatus Micrarchaeaceae archaeon]